MQTLLPGITKEWPTPSERARRGSRRRAARASRHVTVPARWLKEKAGCNQPCLSTMKLNVAPGITSYTDSTMCYFVNRTLARVS